MDHRDPKLLNWNVRGLSSAARREAVKLVIQQVKAEGDMPLRDQAGHCDRLTGGRIPGTAMQWIYILTS
jgi:hypothetical protein